MFMRACLLTSCLLAVAADPAAAAEPTEVRVRAERALALVQASAVTYSEQRTCFSCHHQALTAMAAAAATQVGWTVDATAAKAQSEFTIRYFANLQEQIAGGKGVVGGPYTAGYALAGLGADHWPADETTSALVHYLFQRQDEDGRWRIQTHRPPLEDSDFTATALAIRGLNLYGKGVDLAAARERIALACVWLIATEPQSHEDQSFRLLGLGWCRDSVAAPVPGTADAERTDHQENAQPADLQGDKTNADTPAPIADLEHAIQTAVERLLREQREDGGWSQLPDQPSDAYATGQALVSLRQAGGVPADHSAVRRGIDWLLAQQKTDGSWQVATRSKPIQEYFESGFPHDESQFISISAACWAIMALGDVAGSENIAE